MRLALAGGGTGGHIYPAIAVVEALHEGGNEPADVLWLGVPSGLEEESARARGWQFAPVRAGKVRGMGVRAPFAGVEGLASAWAASRHLRRFRADVLLATGGYVSVPSVLGARMAGVPSVVYLPDVEPGWAVRFSRRFADVVAVTCERSRRYLGGSRVVVTGYPVRSSFVSGSREQARRRLELDSRPAVLALGGSLGARSINEAVLRWAPQWTPRFQVLHVSGRRDYTWVKDAAKSAGLVHGEGGYCLYEYLEDMAAAMLAADLVVSRAGASTLGELTAAGKPGLVVPYPYSGAHQRQNALYLVEEGAAIMLEDAEVRERLGPEVSRLLGDERTLLNMAERSLSLARPEAAHALAELVVSTSRKRASRVMPTLAHEDRVV